MGTIREFRIEGFKSIASARLPLSPFTLLVGPNGAGKTNVVEAIVLLSWLSKGRSPADLLPATDQEPAPLRARRGEDAIRRGMSLRLEVMLESTGRATLFRARFQDEPLALRLSEESVVDEAGSTLLRVQHVTHETTFEKGDEHQLQFQSEQSVLGTTVMGALLNLRGLRDAAPRLREVASALQLVTFVDPVPVLMRAYSDESRHVLRTDAANVSSTLQWICREPERKRELLAFLKDLTDPGILDVQFIRTPRGDVMLAVEEQIGSERVVTDCTRLSDGTLRLLAIAAALFDSRPGVLVIIEELGDALYPAKGAMFVQRLQQAVVDRGLQLLATVHDPAILDAVSDDRLGDVVFCYRDPQQGDSRLVPLRDIPDSPGLLAQGSLGDLVTSGLVDRFAKFPKTNEQKKRELEAFLARMNEVEPT